MDDISLIIALEDGGGPYKDMEAWNGVDGTPLAVVMSAFTLQYKTQMFWLADFAPTNFRTFETPDPPLDDVHLTIL